MPAENPICGWIDEIHKRFRTTSGCFEESDAGFAPKPGMFSVVGHIAHAAQTVEWFIGPTFDGRPFDMDFAAGAAEAMKVASLGEALAWFDRAFDELKRRVAEVPAEELGRPRLSPDNPILPNASLAMVLSAIEDHTAHHRGSLAVYARLAGREPAMPYM